MISEVESEAGVVELVIDRPPVNALRIEDLTALEEGISAAGRGHTTRVVLLRAEGPGFCGGGDVKEVQSLPGAGGILGQARGLEAVSMAIWGCRVPVIAAVQGYCVGAGALIAACADLLVMSADASMVLAEVDNGATTGATHMGALLPERVVRRAMLTGHPIPATDFERFGATGPLVDRADLLGEARALARCIADKPPENVRQLKRSFEAVASPEALRRGYREELSGTFEMNLSDDARRSRQRTIDRLEGS